MLSDVVSSNKLLLRHNFSLLDLNSAQRQRARPSLRVIYMDIRPWVVPVIAGGGAGLIETVATYPLDLVKTQQQLSGTSSVSQSLRAVVGRAGVRGLFKGLSSPVVSEVPRRALKFGANGAYTNKAHELGAPPTVAAVLCGAAAGASETVLHTPFERAKILAQSGSYASPMAAARGLVAAGGTMALYRGFGAYVVRQAVWNGVFFGFVATGKRIAGGGEIGPVQNFCIGLVSGSLATVGPNK